jgi:hypothetical protein
MASTHSANCPVSWRDLRYLRIRYVGFDAADHIGELVAVDTSLPDPL